MCVACNSFLERMCKTSIWRVTSLKGYKSGGSQVWRVTHMKIKCLFFLRVEDSKFLRLAILKRPESDSWQVRRLTIPNGQIKCKRLISPMWRIKRAKIIIKSPVMLECSLVMHIHFSSRLLLNAESWSPPNVNLKKISCRVLENHDGPSHVSRQKLTGRPSANPTEPCLSMGTSLAAS